MERFLKKAGRIRMKEKRTVLSDFNSLIASNTSIGSNNSVTASIHVVTVIGIDNGGVTRY